MNGSVYKLTDRPHRPWRAVYTGPDGRRRTKSFARKAEAERWLRNEVAAIDRGAWVDPAAGKVTFREWADHWLADLDVKPKTAEGYRELLESLIYPAFGRTSLARITPAECRMWVAKLSARGLSASRTRQARAVLRQILATAVHDGRIVRNPVDGVKPPKMRSVGPGLRSLVRQRVHAISVAG